MLLLISMGGIESPDLLNWLVFERFNKLLSQMRLPSRMNLMMKIQVATMMKNPLIRPERHAIPIARTQPQQSIPNDSGSTHPCGGKSSQMQNPGAVRGWRRNVPSLSHLSLNTEKPLATASVQHYQIMKMTGGSSKKVASYNPAFLTLCLSPRRILASIRVIHDQLCTCRFVMHALAHMHHHSCCLIDQHSGVNLRQGPKQLSSTTITCSRPRSSLDRGRICKQSLIPPNFC